MSYESDSLNFINDIEKALKSQTSNNFTDKKKIYETIKVNVEVFKVG